MFKQLLLIIGFLFSFRSYSQNNIFNFPIDSATSKISFQGVVTIEGLKKDALFNKLKLWVINSYPSPKDVINAEDKEIGVLKLKPIFKKRKTSEGLTYDDILYFDLDLYVKDGKYKYVISNFWHSSLIPGDRNNDRTPLEKPFMISKEDTEQMKYYDFRRTWSDEIKSDIESLVTSIHNFLTKKNDADF